jgi:hypothetical protein
LEDLAVHAEPDARDTSSEPWRRVGPFFTNEYQLREGGLQARFGFAFNDNIAERNVWQSAIIGIADVDWSVPVGAVA